MEIHILVRNDRFRVKVKCPPLLSGHSSEVGDIVTEWASSFRFSSYPDIYEKIEWYEHRTFTELMDVKFIEVRNYVGYDHVGDKLLVEGYEIEGLDTPDPKFIGYKASGRSYAVENVYPATCEGKIDSVTS